MWLADLDTCVKEQLNKFVKWLMGVFVSVEKLKSAMNIWVEIE